MVSRLQLPIVGLALLLAAGRAGAQTVTWGGGFPNNNNDVASNWAGDTLPLNNGTETLQFTSGSNSALHLNANANFNAISLQVDVEDDSIYEDITGAHTLTLGANGGGVSVTSNGSTSLTLAFDAPVALAGTQTWSIVANPQGSIISNSAISGAFGLNLTGDSSSELFELNSSSSTFSGGVTLSVTSSGETYQSNTALVVGSNSSGPAGAPTSGPVGTGTLTLGDATTLTTLSSSTITLGNAVVIGDNSNGRPVVIGGPTNQTNPGSTNLTLSGPVTLNEADLEIDVGQYSAVTFTGSLNGFTSGVCLDFGSVGNGSSIAVVEGNITNVARLDLEDSVSLIVGSPAYVGGLEDIGTQPTNYLGMGSTGTGTGFAASGNAAAFLSFLNTSNSAAGFGGTLGFDTISGGPATFTDNIDLTNFTADGFVGLGSATAAVLGANVVITPPGGTAGTAYPFGGGGGTLTVASTLSDGTGGPRSLNLTAGNSPLTLVLNGSLNYSGGTNVDGAALIFDTTLPEGTIVVGNGSTETGYIGITMNSDYSGDFQGFVNRVAPGLDGTENVVGFDSIGSTQTVSDLINMSGAGAATYLGTATSAIFTGAITPYNGSQYQFAAVKGGLLTVQSTLNDYDGPANVTVGLPNPMESYSLANGAQTVSSVTLSGTNTYSGGTTLNSGNLFVTNSSSLGTGTLSVPGNELTGQWAATLATSGGPVSLSNPISIEGNGLAINTGSTGLLTLLGNIQDMEGPGSIGIFGPVSLQGTNTYSGGTTIDAPGAAVTIGSDTGLGTGPVNVNGSTLSFTSANPTLDSLQNSLGTSFTNSVATFSGSPIIYELQLAESTLDFNGPTAVIQGFQGDAPNAGDTINLGAGTVLTIDVNVGSNNGGSYHGLVAGSTGSLVVEGGGNGSLDLVGANTYGGGTTITGGAIVIASNNSALGTGPVNVAGGVLVTNTGVTVTNAISLNGNADIESGLAGYGTFSPGGNLAFESYNGVDPGRARIGTGNSSANIPIPGTLTFGGGTSITFGPNGAYLFAITDANGPAGIGYSTVNVGSTLTLAGGPFDISLFTYAPGSNVAGLANNFNPNNSYTWTLVSASSISGFNPGYFVIDTSNFLNATNTGSFFVSQSGNDLTLNFTPVPEPSTWAMMATGLLALSGAAVRRRRR